MDIIVWKNFAQAAPYHLATYLDESIPVTRWIASLSCGLTIFDNDRANGEPAWLRLKRFCKDHNVRIVKLRLQDRDQIIDTPYDAEGYFFSKKQSSLFGIWNELSYGIGHLDDDKIYIQWTSPRGVQKEVRDFVKLHYKHQEQPFLIKN